MKAVREARLIGALLLTVALGVLLKSHSSVPVLVTISVPFLIRWFFNWDEAEYQHFQKRQNKKPQSSANDQDTYKVN